jgi:hypothetical protein
METNKTTKTRRAPRATMSPALLAYWSQSASASVCRDYATGNVTQTRIAADGTTTTTPAPRPRR